MMKIRNAEMEDITAIQNLLVELDYKIDEPALFLKMQRMLRDNDESVIVFEENKLVVAFMSIHFIPQIGLVGDFARISYFSVLPEARSKGIGQQLEEYCTTLAIKRNCDRIEVHCHERRTAAHKFYERQGYKESTKYLMKMLNNS
jgi:GNAT superfamily N-acetyltransferase